MTSDASANVHTESMLRRGKIMSRAPIISGIRKLPKAPRRIGMATKKTMMVPCMVTIMLNTSGPISPTSGTFVSGQASCHRMTAASRPPTSVQNTPRLRYCLPMVL